jgi:hypothetical protein
VDEQFLLNTGIVLWHFVANKIVVGIVVVVEIVVVEIVVVEVEVEVEV